MRRIPLMFAVFLLMTAAVFAQPSPPQAAPLIVPAGTHVLLELTSPLHTTSATEGSGVYLETAMPVIAGDRVAIPEHTRVLGKVIQEQRPGRVKGRARLRMSFESLILSDNRVLPIKGALLAVPGSSRDRKVDAEGTLEPQDQIDRDVRGVVMPALPGALLGVLGAGGAGLRLGLLGGGLGLGKALATRGDDIVLRAGTKLEIVVQRDVQVN
ncbi:MAG TPA: hypothetical protein VGF06_14325 [Terriglobales bacterium]|jgi:type IV secretion system protein VirB10